jgi:hypothetical protein
LIGFGGWLRSGFTGFCRYNNNQIENQPINKSSQQNTHRSNHNQKKKKHTTKKSANTPILDRTGEVDGGAAAESARSSQNPAKSHRIWRDLTRSGEISLDLARSHQIR